MAVKIRPQVLIRRSRAEVAAFMFDPAHDMDWTEGVHRSRPVGAGPLRSGMIVERSTRWTSYLYVVTVYEPGRLMEMRVDRPFPMTIRYELQDALDGTLVAIQASGEPPWFLRWATPLVWHHVRTCINADLNRLRILLETPASESSARP